MATSLLKAIFLERRVPWRYFKMPFFNNLFSNKLILKLFFNLNISYRPNTADQYIINEIFWMKTYDQKKEFKIKKQDVVIDIGAQAGFFTMYASKKAKQVFSFEPFKENYEILKRNVETNNLDNVKIFDVAVSDSNQKIKLFSSDNDNKGLVGLTGKGSEFFVDAVSLKHIFDSNNILKCDFLKIDCEGSEYDIFFNLPDNYFDRIDKISMEYHYLDSEKNNLVLKDFLESKGFVVETDKEINEVGILYAWKKH